MNTNQHPLAWRWTSEKHAAFPQDILLQLHSINPEEANLLFEHSLTLINRYEVPNGFQIEQIDVKTLSVLEGTYWLRQHQPDLSISVILSWDKATAIRTSWRIFTSYWDDFCYPSSDDLVVWAKNNKWVFFYHHEERFYYSVKKAEQGA